MSDCQAGDTCLTHHLWCDLSDEIHGFLDGISLADLVAREEIRQIASRQRKACEPTPITVMQGS